MKRLRLTRALTLALAVSQAVLPSLSQAATSYEMRKSVPTLLVSSSPAQPGTPGSSSGDPTSALSGMPSLSATGLDFSSVALGQASSTKTLLLSNVGNATLNLGAVPATTGDFSANTDCGSTLGAGGSCHITVSFRPEAEGVRTGVVQIQTSGGTVSANLTGVGYVPLAKATWESTTLDFGGVPVSTALTKTVKLYNDGNVAGTWTSLSTLPSGVTANASACVSVAPMQYCTVSFTYAPVSGDAYSAAGIVPATGTSTNALTITGLGLSTQVGLSTGALAMADTDVGSTSPVRSVQVSNLGNTAVSVGALTVSGPFAATTNCGSSLAVGQACQVNVTFSPTAMGNAAGSLSLGTGAGAQTVDLSGTGLQAVGTLSASSLDWASFSVGDRVLTKTVFVTNTGNKALSLGTATLSGTSFSLNTTCGASLSAGASCNLNVNFVPQATGSYSGLVSVPHALGTLTLSLTGSAIVSSATLSSFLSGGYEWAYRHAGTDYATAQSLCAGTINSTTGWQTPSLASLTALRTAVGVSGLTAQGWPMGASTWYWTTDVYQTGFNYVLNNTTQSFLSTATGVAAALACQRPVGVAALTSATNGSFGSVSTGVPAAQTVTLTNTGALGLTGVAVTVQGTNVSITNNTCAATLAAGGSCAVTVTWAPTVDGTLSGASVNVSSSAANGSVSLALSGTSAPDASLANVSFLMHADSSLADNSTTGLSVTAFGDAAVGTAIRQEGAGALALDGSGDYVTTASSTALGMGTGDFTMEAWVYMNGSQLGSAAVLDMRAPGASTQAKPTIFASSGNLSFYTNGWQPTGATVAASLNAWHHVAYSRTSGVGRFFVDGLQRGSSFTDTNNYGTSSDLVIGQVGDNRSYASGYFKGAIDEVRITKGVGRYTSTFTPVASGGDPYSSNDILVVNAETGTNASPTNLAPSGVTLSVGAGSPTLTTADKKFGAQGIYLAGGSTYVTPAGAVNFGAADLTIEGWFKPSNTVTGTTYAGLVGTSTPSGLTFYIGSGAIRYASQNSSSVVLVPAATTASLLTANAWHHVAFTRTASDKTMRVFIDGALAGSLVLATNPTFVSQNLVIGGDTASAGAFVGYIDDLRVSAGVARYQVPFTVPSTGLVDATVTATVGGYTWSRPTGTTMSQAAARTYCTSLAAAGGGWRLPTRTEAGAVYNNASNRAVLVAAGWPNTTWAWMWATTAYDASSGWVWRTDATTAAQGLANSTIYESFAPVATGYPVSCVK